MKKRLLKGIALMLAVILVIPTLPVGSGSMIANAATKPTISVSKKTIIGTDTSFTLNVKNAGKNVKSMFWYTVSKKVATVETTANRSTGKVTTVGKGTTYIKCKITYKNGKISRPACKVTVKIPATRIDISNANDVVNNRHVIAVGESFDFNTTLTPSNANDTTYWSIEDNGKKNATLDSSTGVVTGITPGLFRLTAVASLTEAGAKTSVINDIINVEIVAKTAKVVSAVVSESTKLTVTFDKAMNSTTILSTSNKLLDSVVVVSMADARGIVANGLGALTGTLSADGKTLTIQSTNAFNGTYGIRLSSSIKTLDGTALEEYNQNIALYDTGKPRYMNSTVDDTGYIVSINFSEAMDFTGLLVTDAKSINAVQAALPTTITMLNMKASYTVSTDKKSLKIDLTSISSVDQNKLFSVVLSNVKDLSGNFPDSYLTTAIFQTDTTPTKPQAQLISVVRTGYNTLTATFSRAIKTTGIAILSNGETLQGAVDKTDATKVNYTLTATAVLLSGTQEVSIAYWNSYNVLPTDTTANTFNKRTVYFVIDKEMPTLLNSVLESVTENGVAAYLLTLTYNKNITLTSPTGYFAAKLKATDGNIYSDKKLMYSAIAKDTKVTLILNQAQIIENGVYTLTIPAGFVIDSYMNMNIAADIQVNKTSAVASNLSAPKSVSQSTVNPNIILVGFDKKLDEISAENLGNYSIAGVTIIAAELIDNSSTGATIQLTMLQGSISATTVYPVTITGIKGYQDSYSVMDKHQAMIPLYENKSPKIAGSAYNYPLTILLTFDEDIKGVSSFKVTQENVVLNSTSVISGRTIIITLSTMPKSNVMMIVTPTQFSTLSDLIGNTIPTAELTRYVNATY